MFTKSFVFLLSLLLPIISYGQYENDINVTNGKVKRMEFLNYSFPDKDWYTSEIYEYNENGDLTKKVTYLLRKKDSETINTYNKSGLLTLREIYNSGKLVRKFEYQYNSKDKIATIKVYDKLWRDDPLLEIDTYHYNNNGDLQKVVTMNAETNTKMFDFLVTYDSNNRQSATKYLVYDDRRSFFQGESTETLYDANGKIAKKIAYTNCNITTKYYVDGKLSKTIHEDKNEKDCMGENGRYIATFTYKNGLLIKADGFLEKRGRRVPDHYKDVIYDAYDQKGNWISKYDVYKNYAERITMKQGYQKRKIAYYD